jgi:tRNA-binding EMAP/Myf-like protein
MNHLVVLDIMLMMPCIADIEYMSVVMNEQNRKVCILCNLKAVAMRGIKSHAMVLAASNEDHTKVRTSNSNPCLFINLGGTLLCSQTWNCVIVMHFQ